MSKLSKEYLFLLNTIKGILHNEETGEIESESVNYERVLRIAVENGIANTIADRIFGRKDAPENIKKEFYKQKMITMSRSIAADNNLQRVYASLDAHKIRGLFLKGTILKKLYPKAYLRSMSDADVYAAREDMDEVYSLMINMGYNTGAIGRGNHYEYMMGKGFKIEYHPELVAISSWYGDRVFSKKHPEEKDIAIYMDIWNHTLPMETYECARQLVPEYHYLYVIMHMMNHFLKSGTGIRSVMDVWVMNNHYADKWDRELIESLLEDYGLRTFEAYALALADRWFDLEKLPYLNKDVDARVLEEYERYILESGTYGSTEHYVSRELGNKTGMENKVRYLAELFFAPYGKMKRMYPVLEKAPVLLPIMWGGRAIDKFRLRGKKTRGKIKTVMKANKQKADWQSELMRKMVE
ncbi:MAG: nucleotidyltransferase family protein [Lachnospiraceae bacterium]|nr:nucleotidyltransferase family protein [Lachnospiraceae bacterium]